MTDFVANDIGSKLVVYCKDRESGDPINLVGYTVALKWLNSARLLQTRTMIVSDVAAGMCEYKFMANELFSPKMRFDVTVTHDNGDQLTGLRHIEVMVRDRLA